MYRRIFTQVLLAGLSLSLIACPAIYDASYGAVYGGTDARPMTDDAAAPDEAEGAGDPAASGEPGDSADPTEPARRPAHYVEGRHLYSPDGTRISLVGFNAMTKYNDHGGAIQIPEIAQTGANVVRFHWDTNEEPQWHGKADVLRRLDTTIARTIEHGMLPMVGLWEATGNWSRLNEVVDWWVDPDVVAIVQKYEEHFLLNIANEAGGGRLTDEEFEEGYKAAITALRDAGYRMPLVIDTANFGRNERYVLNTATALLAHDPLSNLIFSWHPWDGGSHQARYKSAIDTANSLEICFIIGEFAHVSATLHNPVHDWRYLVEYSLANDVGILPWAWRTPAAHDPHNVTTDYRYGSWTEFGAEVVAYVEAATGAGE